MPMSGFVTFHEQVELDGGRIADARIAASVIRGTAVLARVEVEGCDVTEELGDMQRDWLELQVESLPRAAA